MVGLVELWLPILLSAVFVFVVSSVLHMVVQVHKNDYQKLSGEDAVIEAMRSQGVEPGEYMFPCPATMQEMQAPEMQEKLQRGPVGFLTVIAPGQFLRMGKSLIQWFLFSVLISVFAAYIGGFALAAGAEGAKVFRLTATVAILGYAVSYVPNSIWKGLKWGITGKFVLDGVIYGLTTGATFAWLWPAAGP